MRNPAYAAFSALDPFFDIVRQGLADLVDGDHYFDTISSRCGVRVSVSISWLSNKDRGPWRAEGTGLGLAFVREIAHAHGGEARLVPTSQGAEFEIEVPWQVLIVDDDAALREGLAETVADLGHAPRVAASGREALAALARGQYRLRTARFANAGRHGRHRGSSPHPGRE